MQRAAVQPHRAGDRLSDVGQRIFPHVKALLADAEQLELEIRGEAREPAGASLSARCRPSPTRSSAGCSTSCARAIRRSSSRSSKARAARSRNGCRTAAWTSQSCTATARPPRSWRQALATVDSYLIGAAGDRLTSAAEVPFSALHELPFILPARRTACARRSTPSRARSGSHSAPIEADSLPLMRSTVAEARLYTVLPIHAVWNEVKEGRLQAAKIVSPEFQRIVSMTMARTKGPARPCPVSRGNRLDRRGRGTQRNVALGQRSRRYASLAAGGITALPREGAQTTRAALCSRAQPTNRTTMPRIPSLA
jgi:DNA-binding transcriptional LysR family regulator